METFFTPTTQLARATGLAIDTHATFCANSIDALFDAGMHAAEQQLGVLRTFFASATVDAAGFSRQWLSAGAFGWDAPATQYLSHGGNAQCLPIGTALANVSRPELAVDGGGLTR